MAREAKQTVDTVFQRYLRALKAKQKIFNLSDEQVEEMGLEVVLRTKHGNTKSNQIIKGSKTDVEELILVLSYTDYESSYISIEIEDINIIL